MIERRPVRYGSTIRGGIALCNSVPGSMAPGLRSTWLTLSPVVALTRNPTRLSYREMRPQLLRHSWSGLSGARLPLKVNRADLVTLTGRSGRVFRGRAGAGTAGAARLPWGDDRPRRRRRAV